MLRLLENFSHTIDWPSFMAARKDEMPDKRLQSFFAVGTYAPETPLIDTSFVALDFETTGLDATKNDIVSIGLIPFTLSGISCKDAQYHLLKPRQSLSDSVPIHGITHSDVSDAPDLEKIFEELLTAIAGKMVVVHYLHIERYFLYHALKKRLGEGVCFPIIDTMAIEAGLQSRNKSFIQKILGSPRPSLRLADVRQRYGLPVYQSHHALTDALATAELFLAQLAHHYLPETAIQNLWK